MTRSQINAEQRALRREGKKRCNACGEIKPLEQFYYNDQRDVYTPKCKACAVAWTSQFAKENRETINAQRRSLPPAVKELITRQMVKWRKKTDRVRLTLLIKRNLKNQLKRNAAAAGMSMLDYIVSRCIEIEELAR